MWYLGLALVPTTLAGTCEQDVCLVQMPSASFEATEADVGEESAECKSWCNPHSTPWDKKCLWVSCTQCPECVVVGNSAVDLVPVGEQSVGSDSTVNVEPTDTIVPNFDFGQVCVNNLGGTGPQTTAAREIRYCQIAEYQGYTLDLVITNTSEYTAKSANSNGVRETMAQVNLKVGSEVNLHLDFYASGTTNPVEVDVAHITFCDIDHAPAWVGDGETFRVENVGNYYVVDGYEFDLDISALPTLTASSTHVGHGCDNPNDISTIGPFTCVGGTKDGWSVDQSKRCIMLEFFDTSKIEILIRVLNTNPAYNHGRNFVFAGSSVTLKPTAPTSAPTSVASGMESTPASQPPTPAPPTPAWSIPSAAVTNDPHVASLGGDRFDVNQPADYVLLRAPLEDSQPALLDVRASMEPEGTKPCGLYMKAATLRGTWFGEAIVQVRPLKRNSAGSNRAGTMTEWPFSIQISPEGSWMSFADFTAENSAEALTGMVKIVAEKREEYGELLEGQAFTFHIGNADMPAKIIISQAAHQALNLEMANMQALGHRTLGGLLGTEKHSGGVEELTEECKEHRASQRKWRSTQKPLETSRMSASWL